MLSKLCIQNIALIERAEIDFDSGLNILTGETGAGKSIIIDAMNLALGVRADRDIIKTGCSEAVVEAVFQIAGLPEVRAALEELEIYDGDELVLTRRLTAAGRNVCRVNGYIVPLGQLRGITARLIDILGQHEHQSLLDETLHRGMLDGFAGAALVSPAGEMREAYRAFSQAKKEMDSLYGSADERLRRADILRYQIEEIDTARLKVGEEEETNSRIEFLRHAEEIAQAVSAALGELYQGRKDGASALDLTGEASQALGRIAGLSPEYAALQEKTDQVYYQMEDLTGELRALAETLEYDEGELDELVSRSELIRRLERKYGKSVEEVLAARAKMAGELYDIENADARLEELTAKLDKTRKTALACAQRLTALRKKSAERFEKRILEQLKELGMPHARFAVAFALLPEDAMTAHGRDDVRFLISPNPGEDLKPLARTASGGEMSRIMLALKNITAGADAIPTLIFDEIDTGISGKMARVVAQKLCEIAARHQVICVTHTAVIAAMGDHHFYIEKNTDGVRTTTSVTPVEGDARAAEIGRLVGGEVTQTGLEHAREMLAWCRAYKSTATQESAERGE
ncbi:MAG: DNA repair protein RecN [Eubacteriales bacterium]|nr:DNA repair protein RecN [Eubacteriales bacterium]